MLGSRARICLKALLRSGTKIFEQTLTGEGSGSDYTGYAVEIKMPGKAKKISEGKKGMPMLASLQHLIEAQLTFADIERGYTLAHFRPGPVEGFSSAEASVQCL